MAYPYPITDAYSSGRLKVGDGHEVHWEVAGNPDGKPTVMLHGGPGSGCRLHRGPPVRSRRDEWSSVTYDHPIEMVFRYLSEPDTWNEWVPAVMERTQITDGPVGVGTQWKAVDRAGPFRFRFTDELVELDPNERVLFKHHSVNAETEYWVEEIGDKTVARVRFEGDLKGSMRWLDLMPDWMASKIFRADLERLGPFLDQKSAS